MLTNSLFARVTMVARRLLSIRDDPWTIAPPFIGVPVCRRSTRSRGHDPSQVKVSTTADFTVKRERCPKRNRFLLRTSHHRGWGGGGAVDADSR